MKLIKIDFTSYFGLDFFKFFGPLCPHQLFQSKLQCRKELFSCFRSENFFGWSINTMEEEDHQQPPKQVSCLIENCNTFWGKFEILFWFYYLNIPFAKLIFFTKWHPALLCCYKLSSSGALKLAMLTLVLQFLLMQCLL